MNSGQSSTKLNDMLTEFVEKHGETYFLTYFEEYADMVDRVGREIVEAFIVVFGIESVSSCRDAYQGRFDSGAEFAQNLAEDCGDVPRGMSSWIEIDWKASWDNLDYDYAVSYTHLTLPTKALV